MQTTAASKTHPRHGIDIELPAIFGMQLDLIFSRDSCGARHVSDCSRVVGKVWAVKSSFPSIHLPSSCRNIHDNPWESMRISSSSQVLATCSQEKICTSSWWQCVWHQDGPAISRVLGIYPGTVGCEGHQATVFELAAPTTIFRILRKVWEREILQLPVILQIFGLRDQETSVSTRAPARCIGSKLCWIWIQFQWMILGLDSETWVCMIFLEIGDTGSFGGIFSWSLQIWDTTILQLSDFSSCQFLLLGGHPKQVSCRHHALTGKHSHEIIQS